MREVCLIDHRGEKIGNVPIERAREIAHMAGLDLVEVAPNSRPPVCKVMDYGKFRYEQQKKHRGTKHHESQLHEVRVRPNIGKHDLQIKIDKAREFLLRGDKVQVDCRFRGRELAHPEIGHRVCQQVIDAVADVAKVETPGRLEGKRYLILLARKAQAGAAAHVGAPRPAAAPGVAPRAAAPAKAGAPEVRPTEPKPAEAAIAGKEAADGKELPYIPAAPSIVGRPQARPAAAPNAASTPSAPLPAAGPAAQPAPKSETVATEPLSKTSAPAAKTGAPKPSR